MFGRQTSKPDPTPTPTTRATAAFTRREGEILELVSRGDSDKAIAVRLGISIRTVRTHLERIYRSQDVHSRTAASTRWLAHSREEQGRAQLARDHR